MQEKNNATCSICGKDYHVCISCKDNMKAAPWKIHTDTSEHFKVYQIIHGLSTGVYNNDDAKTRLKNVDLSDLNSFRPHIKKIIKDILKEEKSATKPIEQPKVVEEEVVSVEDNLVVEKVEDIKKDEDIDKATFYRKKNYKVNNEVKETE